MLQTNLQQVKLDIDKLRFTIILCNGIQENNLDVLDDKIRSIYQSDIKRLQSDVRALLQALEMLIQKVNSLSTN